MAQSSKKPNSFTKGMQSDVDPNLLPSDTYRSATNGRLVSKQDDSFVLKNAEGNSELDEIKTTTSLYTLTNSGILSNTGIAALLGTPDIRGFQISIIGDGDFVLETFNYIYGDDTYNGATPYSLDYSKFIKDVFAQALQSSTVADKVSINVVVDMDDGIALDVKIYKEDLTSEVMSIAFRPYIKYGVEYTVGYFTIFLNNGYTQVSLPNELHNIVGLASFSDYFVGITTSGDVGGLDTIWKFTLNNDGSLQGRTTILKADLGLVDKTNIRIETSEENKHFHRIYWTDGIQPLRTINLKEDPSYYLGLSANDLNVFKDSDLPAPIVYSIVSGGKVLCGSHSYCYRLITSDGKTSRTSAITNPIHIARTIRNNAYHDSFGGSLEEKSPNAVSLSVSDIDVSFTSIQIIDIRYTSKEGAIEAYIVSESNISGSTFNYTHNGNETKVAIPVGDLLKSSVSWDTCGDLAKKDNRLFATNLTNNAASVDIDFKMKSYNGSFNAHDDIENPDIHEDTLYDGSQYGYLNNPIGDGTKIPGAETPGFADLDDAIRVTFRTKKFDLSKVGYFDNSVTKDSSSDYQKATTSVNEVPLYGSIDKTGDDGYYNNYKNPIFSEKYTGYQRGEIYRFGILFYDKGGNPAFVNPLGDVRMPDGSMDYSTLSDDGTSHVTTGDSGVPNFKHAGNISYTLSGFTAANADSTLEITDASSITTGDVITGQGIQSGTLVTAVDTDSSPNVVTISDVTWGAITSTDVLTFEDPTSDVYGFAIYPRFEIKLSTDTLSKIGGYAIVRVDRTDTDKRIVASGVISQNILYHNKGENGTLKHYNAPMFPNIYSPNQEHESLSHSTFLFDTPESILGGLNYDLAVGDKLKVVAKLDGVQNHFTEENIPHWDDTNSNQGWNHLRNYKNDSYGNLISGRFNPNSNTSSDSYQYSQYVVYSQFEHGVADFNKTSDAQRIKDLGYGFNVGPSEVVSKSKIGNDKFDSGAKNRPFKNRCRFNAAQGGDSDNDVIISVPVLYAIKKFSSETAVWAIGNPAYTLEGCSSMFLSIKDLGDYSTPQYLFHYDFNIGRFDEFNGSSTELNSEISKLNYSSDHITNKLYAQKLYTQIVTNLKLVQYGGSTSSAYENNQYISTGDVDFNPASSNFIDVFGGDTYINMYSISKWKAKASWDLEPHWQLPSAGIIFPVESSVNIDMRDGVFLGSTDGLNFKIHDTDFYNITYSCRNSSKTFVQKPVNFKDVNQYENMIAVSNLKINGDLFDAYTSWDANEIHELETDKGPIYNIFNLRGDLFVLQEKGVSKLSINPRVVVDNADAAAVTVATGTGRIIERNDYIDTSYGSQHFNNAKTTNNAAYWFDGDSSSFCKLVYGQGIAVQDLGITTQNSNVFDALKDEIIGDKPLDSTVGGIHIYHDQRHDEVGVSIYNTNESVHMTYSELSDVMVSHRFTVVVDSVNLSGELYTIGYNDFNGTGTLDENKIWLENSSGTYDSFYGVAATNSLELEFVCNEAVFSSKKFDKLTMYLSGNDNTPKFTNFTFTDSIGSILTNDASLSRMANGKHITPIVNTDGTGKAVGNYLIIKAESTETGLVEVFGALIHNRPTS